MRRKYLAGLLAILCLGLLIVVVYVNVVSIAGAFGQGPPYYGRTTNMDKWTNPLPALGALDLAALAIVLVAGRWIRRQLARRGGISP
jgi:hypothetical protein